MPELPEVETVARQLAPLLGGRRIRAVTLHDPKLRTVAPADLIGCRIDQVYRLGKRVVLALSGGPRRPQRWFAVHLRMTGRLRVLPSSAAPPERHLRATIELDRGQLLYYDLRRFGTFELTDDVATLAPKGVEPFSTEFTPARLCELLAGVGTPLKPWLLRQDRVVGLGNIYASEICFAARLDPRRPAGDLEAAEVRSVHRQTLRILTLAIKHCGTTFSDFQDVRGATGNFRRMLKVYGREGQACRRRGCPGLIARLTQQQRSSFYCPACQAADDAS